MTVGVNPLHHYYRESHLEHVIGEMRRRGPPVLRAHFDGEIWHAREGTRRLRAAKKLGLAPIFVPAPWGKSKAALERARLAFLVCGHIFDRVEVRDG
jgi:hypothetical protein